MIINLTPLSAGGSAPEGADRSGAVAHFLRVHGGILSRALRVLVVVEAVRALVVAEVAGNERARVAALLSLAARDDVATLTLDARAIERTGEVVLHELRVHLLLVVGGKRAEVRGRSTATLARGADNKRGHDEPFGRVVDTTLVAGRVRVKGNW